MVLANVWVLEIIGPPILLIVLIALSIWNRSNRDGTDRR